MGRVQLKTICMRFQRTMLRCHGMKDFDGLMMRRGLLLKVANSTLLLYNKVPYEVQGVDKDKA